MDNEFSNNKLYYYLKPTDSTASKCYGQPKIHKPGIPNNANNSTEFSNHVKNFPIENDKIMVSFDVNSLNTNIPIVDTLNIIKGYVNNDDQFIRKTAIPQGNVLDLVTLVLTTTWCNFIHKFYQQTDGVAIRGAVSLTTIELHVQAHEQTAISTALHSQKVWEQFLDDVFSILKGTHLNNISITSLIFI